MLLVFYSISILFISLSCLHHLEADSLLEAHDNWWWNKKEAAKRVAQWMFATIFFHDNRLKHREERQWSKRVKIDNTCLSGLQNWLMFKITGTFIPLKIELNALDCISFSVSCFAHHLFHVTTNGIMRSTFVQLDFNQIQNFSNFFAKWFQFYAYKFMFMFVTQIMLKLNSSLLVFCLWAQRQFPLP